MAFRRYKSLLFHLLGISFFVGYEIVILFIFGTPPTWKGYLAFALDITTFYVNFLWVLPQLFIPGRRLLFLLRLASLIAVHIIIRNLITYWHVGKVPVLEYLFTGRQVILGIWRLLYVLGLGFFVGFVKYQQRQDRERHKLQLQVSTAYAETARVETAMLQMQLSPHLLFNGLNFIQAKVQGILPGAVDVMSLMADIIRYSLIDVTQIKKVKLAEEVTQINNRIRLQAYLHGTELSIRFNTELSPDAENLELPPSLLLTLVDNVMKYGVLDDTESPAIINLSVVDSWLCFQLWNQKAVNIASGNGLGIKSVQRIIEYYYPGKYVMNIDDEDYLYHLNLEIEL